MNAGNGKVALGDPEKRDGDTKGHISQPGDDKGLGAGVGRFGLFVPESDQRVGTKPHRFPSQIQKYQVAGNDNYQHGEYKKVHKAEIAGVAAFMPHVAHRIDMNKAGYEGDHERHQRSQGIIVQIHVHME